MARGRKPAGDEGGIDVQIGETHRLTSDGDSFKLERRGGTDRWVNPTWHGDLAAVANRVMRDRILRSTANDMRELKGAIAEAASSVIEDMLPIMEIGKVLQAASGKE